MTTFDRPTLSVLARELSPFLPLTAARLREALQARDGHAWNALPEGAQLAPTLSLFPRALPQAQRTRAPISSS